MLKPFQRMQISVRPGYMDVYISAIINLLKALQILKQNQNKQDFSHK